MTADLIVTNALVVTADAAGTVVRGGAVAVTGGRIGRIGTAAAIGTGAREVIDASGMLLMPGLVNTHCHAANSLFRGLVEDLPLEPWLQTVWKAEGAILTPDTVRLGGMLGFAELLLGGVTTVMDMFWHPRETVAAARAVGLPRLDRRHLLRRARGGRPLPAERRLADGGGLLRASSQAPTTCCPAPSRTAPTPSGPRACGRRAASPTDHGGALLHPCRRDPRRAGDVIEALWPLGHPPPRRARPARRAHGARPLRLARRRGDRHPRPQRRHRRRTIPMSNLKLASGFARVPDMLAAGVRVTLGTDGAISGNDLDMWMALRLAATLHKAQHAARRCGLDRGRRCAWSRCAGAEALGAADRIGSLEPGKFADMILIDLRRPHAVPLFDPLTHLVYSCAKSDVRHVFVGGERVVRDGALTRIDLAEMLDEVEALAPRIAASIA